MTSKLSLLAQSMRSERVLLIYTLGQLLLLIVVQSLKYIIKNYLRLRFATVSHKISQHSASKNFYLQARMVNLANIFELDSLIYYAFIKTEHFINTLYSHWNNLLADDTPPYRKINQFSLYSDPLYAKIVSTQFQQVFAFLPISQ